MLYSRTLLFIHSIYNSLHLLAPNSQSIPPPLLCLPWKPQICSLCWGNVLSQVPQWRAPGTLEPPGKPGAPGPRIDWDLIDHGLQNSPPQISVAWEAPRFAESVPFPSSLGGPLADEGSDPDFLTHNPDNTTLAVYKQLLHTSSHRILRTTLFHQWGNWGSGRLSDSLKSHS